MNKWFKNAAFLLLVSIMAVSCLKETELEDYTCTEEYNIGNETYYCVDGVLYDVVINGQQEWMYFLSQMVALAEEGYTVSIFHGNHFNQTCEAKDVVTYTTFSQDDALMWAEKKYKEGYDVTIEYDRTTGKYNCIATK